MDRRLHQLESFITRGSDGHTYKVRAYEHMVRDESLQGDEDRWESTGLAEYRIDDGRRVDIRGDGSLEIAGTGVRLDPK